MIQGVRFTTCARTSTAGATEEDRLLRCYLLKSAALYGAATKMGVILTAPTDNEGAAKLEAAGADLGFSYQFLDDVADVVAGVAEVGKERGMDAGHSPPSICSASTARAERPGISGIETLSPA